MGSAILVAARLSKRDVLFNALAETMNRVKRKALFVMCVWVALIFVTSSFVIPFNTFVQFIQGLSEHYAFKQWFAQFWLVSWFFVVKGWHATEYAIMTCIGTAVLHKWTNWSYTRCVAAALAFAVLFATSDEWHQTFVPGRDGCVKDVLIDSMGAGIAVLILVFGHSRKIERIRRQSTERRTA